MPSYCFSYQGYGKGGGESPCSQMVTLGNVESVKSVSDLFCPVSGVVADINIRLSDSPELLNSDPYGEGWMVRIEPKDVSELDGLLSPAEYADYIGAESE